jgi:type II secretory pathway pseudopilin PulG
MNMLKRIFKSVELEAKIYPLIELLVVTAILGILAAVILPNVSSYIGSGQRAANDTEKAMVQSAIAAAMTDAQVRSITASTVSSVSNPQIVGSKKTVNVGDYFAGGSLGSLLGKYTFDTNGAITDATYP